MHQIRQMNSLPQDQRGATLIVALILLVLLSLIGVSTLKGASVAEKMSSADYQKNVTFRASESAVDISLQDLDLISDTIVDGLTHTKPIDVEDPHTEATVAFVSVGSSYVPGASIGGVSGARIMITSTGSLVSDENTFTRTVHGVVKQVPAIN